MKEIKFLVKNGVNRVIPQRSLHVTEFRFDSLSTHELPIKTAGVSYIFVHCNVLRTGNNFRSQQAGESSSVIEYLPFPNKNGHSWKRNFNDFVKTDCVIEEPIELFLSMDGKTDSKIEFSGVLVLRCKEIK